MSNRKVSHEKGYGRPPKSGQFKKGQSGNPKGRPKGSINLATLTLREARERIRISGPKPRTITKQEAMLKQLTNQAAQGNLRAMRELIPLLQWAEVAFNSKGVQNVTRELDHQIIQSILRRMADLKNDSLIASEDQRKQGGKSK